MGTGSRRVQVAALLMVMVSALPLTVSGGQDQEAFGQPMLGEQAPGFTLETVAVDAVSLDVRNFNAKLITLREQLNELLAAE